MDGPAGYDGPSTAAGEERSTGSGRSWNRDSLGSANGGDQNHRYQSCMPVPVRTFQSEFFQRRAPVRIVARRGRV